MPLFDLFGVKKDLRPEEDVTALPSSEPAPAGKDSRRGWGIALALNAIVVLAASGLLVTRVVSHLTATQSATAPAHPQPKPKTDKATPPPTEAKPAEAKPAPAKPAPAKPAEAKPTPAKPAEAKPAPAKPAEAKPAPAKPAEAKPAGKAATRPVPFTYTGNGAKEVFLMGPFLVRSGGRKQMFKDSKGAWQATVYLKIGESYKYRFEVTDSQGRRKLTAAETVEVLQP